YSGRQLAASGVRDLEQGSQRTGFHLHPADPDPGHQQILARVDATKRRESSPTRGTVAASWLCEPTGKVGERKRRRCHLQSSAAHRRENHQVADEIGLASGYKYTNYASQFQDPFAGYGQANKERLRSIAEKHDPSGVFQELSPGGFKVTKGAPQIL
ncbi:FAD binding domain-containing protein, partial [Colletotrichum costaricense]